MRNFSKACLPALLLPLFACGGSETGGGDVSQEYPALFDPTSQETSVLTIHGLDTTSLIIASTNGSLDRTSGRVTGGGLTGDINETRTVITLDDGGTVTIVDGAPDYVATFSAEPAIGNPSIGVLGTPTALADLPGSTVTATYSGATNFLIVDGTSLYELVGGASVTADFGAADLDATFSALDGTRTDGLGAPVNVSNVATVSINDAEISGNTFSGGTASLSSVQITTDLTGAETVTTSGGFYGPDAGEVGGVVLVDDTATGSLLLLGDFVGN